MNTHESHTHLKQTRKYVNYTFKLKENEFLFNLILMYSLFLESRLYYFFKRFFFFFFCSIFLWIFKSICALFVWCLQINFLSFLEFKLFCWTIIVFEFITCYLVFNFCYFNSLLVFNSLFILYFLEMLFFFLLVLLVFNFLFTFYFFENVILLFFCGSSGF